MLIKHSGGNSSISNDEIEYAVRWCMRKLVGPRLTARLNVNIKHVFLEDGTMAEMDSVSMDGRRWRHFNVWLSKKRKLRRLILRDLFHECVHIKQLALNEKTDHISGAVVWKKRVIDDSKISYRDLPWEKEAFRKEANLYRSYKRHIEKERITF